MAQNIKLLEPKLRVLVKLHATLSRSLQRNMSLNKMTPSHKNPQNKISWIQMVFHITAKIQPIVQAFSHLSWKWVICSICICSVIVLICWTWTPDLWISVIETGSWNTMLTDRVIKEGDKQARKNLY